MVNIYKAMNWLKTGKRIKKSNWKNESYWYMAEDFSIMYSDGTKAVVHPNQILSDDWEIWEEENKLKGYIDRNTYLVILPFCSKNAAKNALKDSIYGGTTIKSTEIKIK